MLANGSSVTSSPVIKTEAAMVTLAVNGAEGKYNSV